MPRAILSVYNKAGLETFANDLVALGWDLIASGGTARILELAGIPITPVEQVTHASEMLAGRVKTLHPAIHAAILARDTPEDMETLKHNGYAAIDMVVCNLYPFQSTVSQSGVTLDEAIEQIDIGGVTLVRAAAKNFRRVTVVSDPSDYSLVINMLRSTGQVDEALRRQLASKAFALTRDYDTAIHAYLLREFEPPEFPQTELPDVLSLGLTCIQKLRYGENPHQMAALYATRQDERPLGGELLSGKELSYNNLLDIDSAWRAVNAYETPAVVIVKHLNPCGIATAPILAEAFPLALASDPSSAYGGVIAVNRIVDDMFVAALDTLFVEAIAAPDFTPTAQQLLAEKRRNCRVLRMEQQPSGLGLEIRGITSGLLIQTPDRGDPAGTNWKVVTERRPSSDELQAMRFAWKAAQHVKSNAIVIAWSNATVGIGGGLPSRVDATYLAVHKAGERARGAALASDAFFPFPDSIQVAAQAGVTCVVQPGGSIRDAEVIEAANAAGLAMVFTGIRHFRH
ncbi:MAG TPA: bifunctional phosphoribosylaminoimidazolecarboxamide formyltransferase/IMP cyclohydrolase [Aggregatilineaceae bacterium]|nr:bifunctional phosphoribosylaminoimidazolecarboxamide formyltransferase/IMP cyclohydrolase [Aggregatilineaceae bacterium]